jgi:hypothetical protein
VASHDHAAETWAQLHEDLQPGIYRAYARVIRGPTCPGYVLCVWASMCPGYSDMEHCQRRTNFMAICAHAT